jgi:tRNA A-37 threonylcarbamoyl transferase component Bud32
VLQHHEQLAHVHASPEHCACASCSIYEAVGKGKHSVVYKGRRKKTIQYYAIKSVDKVEKARVLQEARQLSVCQPALLSGSSAALSAAQP